MWFGLYHNKGVVEKNPLNFSSDTNSIVVFYILREMSWIVNYKTIPTLLI